MDWYVINIKGSLVVIQWRSGKENILSDISQVKQMTCNNLKQSNSCAKEVIVRVLKVSKNCIMT